VKLIRTRRDQLVFEISRPEKALLLEVLRLYPLVSPTHRRLSQKPNAARSDDHQRLLEESLAAQREENRRHIRGLLDEPGRFQTSPTGFHFKITRPEIEWLLQVLNDVRIGSWIALGSPDTQHEQQIAFDKETAPHVRSMELAGAFEMVFLAALTGH